MATHAPITGAPTGARPFTINGVVPFADEDADEYVRAAHAIACLGNANTGDGNDFYSTDQIVAAGFDAIALLLAHACRIMEARP